MTPRHFALLLLCSTAASAQSFPSFAVVTQPLGLVEQSPATVVVEDLDGDGLVDLVFLPALSPHGVAVSLGLEDSTFAAPQVTPGSSQDTSVLIDDIMGSSQPDVVTVGPFNEGPVEIHSYQNSSGGVLLSPVTSTITFSTEEVAYPVAADIGDVDGDGRADLLLSLFSYDSSGLGAAIARNLGNGAFGDPIEIHGAPPAGWRTLGLADLDADGDLDVVALRGSAQNPLQSFVNDGTGVLTAVGLSGQTVGQPYDGTFADLDADGFTDAIVVTGEFTGRSLLRGQGDGTFQFVTDEAIAKSTAPLVVDVNGDATPDLVSGGAVDGQPFLFVAMGSGPFVFEPQTGFAVGGPAVLVDLKDVDGDGIGDAILATQSQSEVVIVRGLPNGTFITPQRATDIATPFELALADADVDGDTDVLTVHQSGTAVSLLLNDAGTLAPAVPLGMGQWAQHLVAGDLDGDGRPDVINDLGADFTLAAWKNLAGAEPSFAPLGSIAPGGAEVLVLGDVEPDGDLDLVATRLKTGTADVFLGQGDGTFAPANTLDVGTKAYDALVADLDADGHADIAVAAGDDDQITWFAGHGDGTLGPGIPIPTGLPPDRLAQADLDGDGVLDLAASTLDFGPVVSLRGLGAGTFAVAGTQAVIGKPHRLLVLDADRDGVPDLATTSPNKERISLLRGIGDGTLDPERRLLGSVGAEDIAVADFDADGYPDIAVTTAQPAEVWVHFNLAPPFASLGFALTASYGTPKLLVTGEPVATTAVSFTVIGVPAHIPGFVFTSLSTAYLPYKGGTLVPSPDAALPVQTGVPLTGRWPGGLPAGTATYFQAWVAAGSEVAASNAVVGISQ